MIDMQNSNLLLLDLNYAFGYLFLKFIILTTRNNTVGFITLNSRNKIYLRNNYILCTMLSIENYIRKSLSINIFRYIIHVIWINIQLNLNKL